MKASMKRNLSALLFLTAGFLFLPASIQAQATATIRGKVLDSGTGEAQVGVAVIVREVRAFAQTDFDGKFTLTVPPGTHKVTFQMVGFDTEVRTVTVKGGQTRVLNLVLGVKVAKEVVVKGRAINNTEAAMLNLQRKAGSVSDGISAEAIKRSPDSSAGDVLKRVTGITLIDSKFVFVRGLGERYSSTLLNGSFLPSPEPQKRVVPMDMFPAGLIKNIRVIKSFLPEDPGEFSGGLVKIETKEYPDKFAFSVGLGLGGNTFSTGQHFLRSGPRGGGEVLGRDSGSRDLPDIMDSISDAVPYVEGSTAVGGVPSNIYRLGVLGLNNTWAPKRINAGPDRKLSFSVGDTIKMGDGRFGYVVGSSYSRSFRKRDAVDRRWQATSLVGRVEAEDTNYLLPLQQQDSTRWTEEVLWGNLMNLAYEVSPGNQFYSKTLISYQSESYVREANGLITINDQVFAGRTSGFISRELLNQTFGGKHAHTFFGGRPHTIEWSLNFSKASRTEPDLKQEAWVYNAIGGGTDVLRLGVSPDGSRFFSESEDITDAIQLSYTLPFRQWDGFYGKLKFGAMASDRAKDFNSKAFNYRRRGGLTDLERFPVPGDLTFNSARVYAGDYLLDQRSQDKSTFEAQQKIHAFFGQVDMPIFLPKLRFIGGARYEDNYQVVRTYNPFQRGAPDFDINRPGIGEIKSGDLLPSANVVYEWRKKMNFRFGYSETVTRPDARELSDFNFSEYFGADIVRGNPFLTQTYIHNYDFRYEFYMTASEYIGVGFFLKNMVDPIETVGEPVAGSNALTYTFTNAEEGQIRGIEFDVRKDFLKRFRAELNLFLIRSRVTVMSYEKRELIRAGVFPSNSREATLSPTNLERPLQGQSDFVYNIKVSYFLNEKKTTSIGLFYNVFGDRISAVGAEGAPDTVEESTAVMDLVFSHVLNDNLKIKASIKNITDPKFKTTQEAAALGSSVLYNEYRKGISYSFGLTYKF